MKGWLLIFFVSVEMLLRDLMMKAGRVTWNDGIAFGFGNSGVMAGVLVALMLCALWWWRSVENERLAAGMMLAGGIANLYDRWRFSAVRDYIPYPGGLIGNGADILIVMGLLTALMTVLTKRKNA